LEGANVTFKAGDTIAWKAAGKGARVDGRAGQIVTGTVLEVTEENGEQWLHVRGHFESIFDGHMVPAKKARRVASV
jgi:hypothetical protein